MKNKKEEQFLKEISEITKKKHTILPKSITLQLKDLEGNNLEIGNVLFHLNIYIGNSGEYYTYSSIPTNNQGTLSLTREQIISNTELKHHYAPLLILENRPVKFEIFILGNAVLSTLISSLGNYLSNSLAYTIADLKRKEFSEIQIKEAISKIRKAKERDYTFYELLKENNNSLLNYTEENAKIRGQWESEDDFNYELKVGTN